MSDDISPAEWQRLEPILDHALELPADTRAAFLDSACAGDDALRARAQQLLDAEGAAGDFLDTSIADRLRGHVSASHDEAAPTLSGTRIGAYRVVRMLGRGGMGAVFLAERADGQFEQRVALKLIRHGMSGDEMLRRFLRERQIHARLEHPHIARLYDGGLTADGQPWFAMEYVDGAPITRYAAERELSIEQRLQLFRTVCEAVQHAHQMGVVHRDIKPANLLVDAAGAVKLLDFGVARLVQDAEDSAATQSGARLLTPEYAAPEQIRGDEITAATDVYALGVVLYELLAGLHPFRNAEQNSVRALERRVCEQEPAPPSTRVTTRQLRRRLAGDLDAVVLRALEKEPAQRYPSVAALLDDMRRCENGLPVHARRGNMLYRARKLLRRRRSAAMAALAILVFGVASGMIATRARPPAAAQRLYEEGVRAFHQQDLHSARRLLRAALAEDSLFALAAFYALRTEWALALPTDTLLDARLRRLADRLPQRERLLLRARMASAAQEPALLAVAETLVARYPEEADGQLHLGRALSAAGELYRALPHLERAIAMDSLGLRGTAPDCRACDAFAAAIATYYALDSLHAAQRSARRWVQLQPSSGRAWFALAEVLEWQAKAEEALHAVRAAAPHAPGNPYIPIYPALLDIRAGEFERADRLLREAARGGSTDVQAEALWFLVISLRYQGRLRDALAAAAALAELRPELHTIAHAQARFEQGHAHEAAAGFAAAAVHAARELERNPAAAARMLAWQLTHSAEARLAAGDVAGAERLADSIAAFGARTLSLMHQRLQHHVRGVLHEARGEYELAERALQRATLRPDATRSPYSRTSLAQARVLLALGRPHEAVHVLQRAFAGPLEAANFYTTHTELHELLARAFDAARQPDSARVHYAWVLRAWQHADPEFAARRELARLRLAR